LRFPFNKKSECQYEEWNDCKDSALKGIKWDDRCKDINHGFEDDCEGFANSKECDEHWATPKIDCPANHTPIFNDKGEAVCRDDIEASEDEKEKEKVESCIDIFPSICFPDHSSNDLVKEPTPTPGPGVIDTQEDLLNIEGPETEGIEEEEVVEEEEPVEEETTDSTETESDSDESNNDEGADSGVN
jgi:hypothetical protein